MAPPSTSTERRRPDDIIGSLTTILSTVEGEMVFVTCVDEDGFVGDSEAYASKDQPKSSLPFEHLFNFPQAQGADAIVVTSRAAGSLEAIAESDLEFTRALIDAADSREIEVLDHVLVHDGEHLGLRAVTDLWS
jgi:DNA repair protein RadC